MSPRVTLGNPWSRLTLDGYPLYPNAGLIIGSVTTTSYGGQASASVSGVAPGQILDLVLPLPPVADVQAFIAQALAPQLASINTSVATAAGSATSAAASAALAVQAWQGASAIVSSNIQTMFAALPTIMPSQIGALWNNNGTICVVMP